MKLKNYKIIKFLCFIISVAILSAGIISNIFAIESKDDKNKSSEITILFTHDMHSHLDVETYFENGIKKERRGLAKIKSVKDEKLKENKATFLLDAGDFAMGTPFQVIFRERASELKSMAEVGFDVTTLGNHEFDYRAQGLTSMLKEASRYEKEKKAEIEVLKERYKYNRYFLANNIKEFNLPSLVVSNVNWDKSLDNTENGKKAKELKETLDDYGAKDYVVVEKEGVKIAVFGLMGDNAIETAPMAQVDFDNYIERAKEITKRIKEKEEVDLIVCLSHSGTNPDDTSKSEDEKLAKEVSDINLIVSGHSHTLLKEPIKIGNTVIASCGQYNDNIGIVKYKKDKEEFDFDSYEILPLDEKITNDTVVYNYVKSFSKEIDELYFKRYGMSYEDVISSSDVDFTPVATLGKEQGEDTLGNLIADSYIYSANKTLKEGDEKFDVALVPAGTIRASISEGDITVADAFNISSLGVGKDELVGYPLVDVYLTGKELKNLAEVDATISDDKNEARMYFSGFGYNINQKRLFLNRATDFRLLDMSGKEIADIDNSKLYRVVGGLYSAQMLGIVKDNSFGLLSIEPKDKEGNVIEDFESRILKDSNGNEIKEWYAVADYLKSEYADGISVKYKELQGRKVINNTYNPIQLLKQPNHIAIMLLGIILIPIVIIVSLIVFFVSRRNKRRGFTRTWFNKGKYSSYRGYRGGFSSYRKPRGYRKNRRWFGRKKW